MVRRLGVDVGGTGVRAALVSADGQLESPIERRALADRSVQAVVAAVSALATSWGAPSHVGLGIPGFVRSGRVLASPNFPEWQDVPIGEHLEAVLRCPVSVENDANAAAYGAWLARGACQDLVLLTLGTGVGGGVVSGGRLLRGAGGTGGEVGHIYVGGVARCGCGGVGCLETWCSDVGFSRLAEEYGHSGLRAAEVVARADAGESWAEQACERVAEHLGRGLVTLVNLFNPDLLVLSGGLAAAQHRLNPGAQRWFQAHGIAASVEWVRWEWEGRADAFAITGAALAFR
jgi:glucokinase